MNGGIDRMDGRLEKIAKTTSPPPAPPTAPVPLSKRGGTLILRGITLFLASGRGARFRSAHQTKHSSGGVMDKDKCMPRVLEIAKRNTRFTRYEIEILFKIYRNLITMNKAKSQQDKFGTARKQSTVNEGLDRIVFRELLHNTFDIVTEDMLMDRIFCVWDKTNSGVLTPESWFAGLSIFLKGTMNEKINFCFAVYDLNGDGYISKEEMFQLLKNSLIKHPQEEDPDEGVKDLVEIVLRKLDKDRDGRVSLRDYQISVGEEPLLLEAFGNCLPTDGARETFLSTIHL